MKNGNHFQSPVINGHQAKDLSYLAKKPVRIGITLPPMMLSMREMDFDQMVWSNGLVQNAYFLARTLEKIPGVKVYAVNNFPLARYLDIEYTEKGPGYLTAIIEVCTKLGPIEARAFRTHKGMLIHHVAGNTMALNLEHLAGGSSPGDLAHNDYDAVWCLPHTYEMSGDYFKLMHNCPVDKVPHIWDPHFLPKDWGYVQGTLQNGRRTAATFEPSMSVVKTPHMSILVAENEYRRDDRLLDGLYVFGHEGKTRSSSAFLSFMDQLAIREVTMFMPRVPIAKAMKTMGEVGVVVATNWMNELNYNWYELVHGGYPLVHNSEMLGAGYKYPGFDALAGGQLLHQVLESHDDILPDYKEAAQRFLQQFRPDTVRPLYQKLLKTRLGELMP